MAGNLMQLKVEIVGGDCIIVPEGTVLLELARKYQHLYRYDIVAAKVNNDIEELTYRLTEDCRVEFIDLSEEDGMRIYRRSLYFLLIKAANELFPDRELIMSHPISNGLYCELRGSSPLTPDEVKKIEDKMHEIASRNIPFVKKEIPLDEAREMFLKTGRTDRIKAIEYRGRNLVTIYECDGLQDYFYGYMVPHTGYIKVFELRFRDPGMIIRFPNVSDPLRIPPYEDQNKLFNIIMEQKRWTRILEVDNVGSLNEMISKGKGPELVRVAEALQEKKIAQIADMIAFSPEHKKVVLISGPSSSGKTTFAKRLSIQLRVNGLKPVTISLDDYFVSREQTPRDEKGDYDFETLEAIDLELFNWQLSQLLIGEEVQVPIFNFQLGCRDGCRPLKIDEDNVLVIEGIHGLNERLTASIPKEKKFKIYVSALTSMNIDDHNRIPSTDTRIIRRIVRDQRTRAISAADNILRWPSVRRGEEKNIFPFQENADVMFNSSLVYEHPVLKTYAEPLLKEITPDSPAFAEAKRLLKFLSYFLPMDSGEIPPNSILREFVGGSCFY